VFLTIAVGRLISGIEPKRNYLLTACLVVALGITALQPMLLAGPKVKSFADLTGKTIGLGRWHTGATPLLKQAIHRIETSIIFPLARLVRLGHETRSGDAAMVPPFSTSEENRLYGSGKDLRC
jgi:hypothetical protein